VRLSYEDPIDATTKSPTMPFHSGRRVIGVIEFFGAWHLWITLGGFYAFFFKRVLAILCSLIYDPTFTFAFTRDIALRHLFCHDSSPFLFLRLNNTAFFLRG
jgi:hypothetical protein